RDDVLAYFKQLTNPDELYKRKIQEATSKNQGASGMRATSLAVLFLLCAAVSAQDKKKTGVPPVDESLKAMKVHEGTEVSFWAGEPGLINPTDMDIDERGRIWVVESMNYRGSKMRPEGDRILIMEDTDGDGKADSYKTFYQDKSI